jgi:hypothetical protein
VAGHGVAHGYFHGPRFYVLLAVGSKAGTFLTWLPP